MKKIVNELTGQAYYVSFDGKTASKDAIQNFQIWHNRNGYKPTLIDDGIAGKATLKAISKYGDAFDSIKKPVDLVQNMGRPSSADTMPPLPSLEEQKIEAKKGKVWNKALGAYTFAKEQGIIDKALGALGLSKSSNEPIDDNANIPKENKGLSDGAKIGIAVGSVLVLGLIIYAVTKK